MLLQKFAGLLAGFLYKIYASTFRYELSFEDPADKKVLFEDLTTLDADPGKNLIYACFHQDDLSCLPYFAYKNICILISNSKDGQILASAVEHMGYQTVRGSSHRGGVAGLLAGMRKVIDGHKMTIAVDGPRGPIYKVKEGITAVSDKSKRPIVPVRGYPKWKFVFKKSWNKATLPLPFTKIQLHIGKIGFYSTQGLEDKMKSL
ncbi:lysophospholipid acyltransferase family protein [Peredibacter sp. HCB2-198]|uniref:lysophospholipid acyltransferase family protein n=1 Tax=Peredibacter sp. HCB2-198 TaxID=3383025 RepID=UPI0038B6A0DD